MPKYYCKNGDYQVILDAIDIKSALRKMTIRMINNECDCALLSLINERGFSFSNDTKTMSMIPLLKEMDIDLPPDDVLLKRACASIGIDYRTIPQEAINWFLYGEENGS